MKLHHWQVVNSARELETIEASEYNPNVTRLEEIEAEILQLSREEFFQLANSR